MATNPDPLVPVSTFIEALAGVLSDEEQAALAETLSIPVPQGVAPGDLITAELFNTILLDIQSLTTRVAALETAGSVTVQRPNISRVTPESVTVGEDLVVEGENLDPEHLTAIFVGESRVSIAAIKQGSSVRLVFAAPAITGLQSGPRRTTVRVDNPVGSDTHPVTVNPAPLDTIEVVFSTRGFTITPDEEIQPNTTYEILVDLQFSSTVAQDYRLEPILNLTGETGTWSLTPERLDQAVPVSNISPFRTQLRMALTTGDSGSASLSIQATGLEFPQASDADSITSAPITVSEEVIAPSTDIILVTASANSPHAHYNATTKTISVLASDDSDVNFFMGFNTPNGGNDYTMTNTTSPASDAGGWTTQMPPTWSGLGQGVVVTISPGSGDGAIELTVTGPAGNQPYVDTFNMRRVTTLPTN